MSALLVGYARVSAHDQDLTAQRDALAALGVSVERSGSSTTSPAASSSSASEDQSMTHRHRRAAAVQRAGVWTMLDWAHDLTLRAVADGDYDDSPALRTLVASGLVEQGPDGGYAVTPAGRVALEDRDPRCMRIGWLVAAVGGAVYVAGTVVDWLS